MDFERDLLGLGLIDEQEAPRDKTLAVLDEALAGGEILLNAPIHNCYSIKGLRDYIASRSVLDVGKHAKLVNALRDEARRLKEAADGNGASLTYEKRIETAASKVKDVKRMTQTTLGRVQLISTLIEKKSSAIQAFLKEIYDEVAKIKKESDADQLPGPNSMMFEPDQLMKEILTMLKRGLLGFEEKAKEFQGQADAAVKKLEDAQHDWRRENGEIAAVVEVAKKFAPRLAVLAEKLAAFQRSAEGSFPRAAAS